jgi:RimJ/RimL family protein N-acetyltransferase
MDRTYLSWRPHASLDDTRTVVERWIADCEAGKSASWLIRKGGLAPVPCSSNIALQDDEGCLSPFVEQRLLLGSIGLRYDGHRAGCGYCLARDAWGSGVASEALRAVVEYAFTSPAIQRVDALCDTENTRSMRVLEKCGFTREGTLRRLTILPNLGDTARDMVSYAIVL